MKFLLSSSIDTEAFEANSVKKAVKVFEERLKYRSGSGSAGIKDQYLCLIIAVHNEWNEHPTHEIGEYIVLEQSNLISKDKKKTLDGKK